MVCSLASDSLNRLAAGPKIRRLKSAFVKVMAESERGSNGRPSRARGKSHRQGLLGIALDPRRRSEIKRR
jgi:hypothetical protein